MYGWILKYQEKIVCPYEDCKMPLKRPDKEKLVAFAGAIECMDYPALNSEAAIKALVEAKKMLMKVSVYLRKEANNL